MTDPDRTNGAMALIGMVDASTMAQALYVAAKLGVADILADGPKTSEQVASSVDADADAIYRLLRALAALGVCAELDGGRFALTDLGTHLRSGVEGSVRSYVLHWAGSARSASARLLHCVKNGRNPRDLVTGKDPFESLSRNSEAERIFDDAMGEMSRLVAAGVIRSCDFSGIGRLVDVGGGYGALLGAILSATPVLRGVLFDRPQVLERARDYLQKAGVADRCEVVPGSFFDAVPAGADAYMLKSVLHDWNDAQAQAILANIRRAMNGHGTLLIVERVLPDRMETCAGHRFTAASDLLMMVAASGRERTEGEYRALLKSSAFLLTRTSATAAHYTVIEAQGA